MVQAHLLNTVKFRTCRISSDACVPQPILHITYDDAGEKKYHTGDTRSVSLAAGLNVYVAAWRQ